MAAAGPATQADWAQAFGRLMGRNVFPPDRNSFIHSPLELIGIALGIAECRLATDAQRAWLASTIQAGFADRQFVDPTAQAAAACAERIVSATTPGGRIGNHERLVKDLQIGDLVFLTSLALLVSDRATMDIAVAEQEILSRVLTASAPAQDVAEAAGLYVVLKRAIDRTVLASRSDVDPVARIVALCRRFPLFVERLQARQRQRTPYTVKDEYDVQDLLHAILKLHFDDVRPEEWTPSYAGNASRIDFLLLRERTIIEAKMTRPKLGQKEVTNESIISYA